MCRARLPAPFALLWGAAILLGAPRLRAEAGAARTNSIGVRLVRLPAGHYRRGSVEGGDFDERPVHEVTIGHPFWIGETEVTNAQYERFDPSHRALRGKLGFSRGDDEAVIFVSWHEATRFCRWLSEREEKPYRLPTEAEWEYACRAGTTTPFSTGDEYPEERHLLQKEVWEPRPVDLTVGRFPANPWGLRDMHGNVEEWCRDWYGPYRSGPQTDPVGPPSGDFRVTRGGSHSVPLASLRSANRLGTLPEDRSWIIGFRVVEAPKPLPSPAGPRPAAEVTSVPLWAREVRQEPCAWDDGPDPERPWFSGPRPYVHIPPGSNGPMFSRHNHQPALVACANGDLLAIWYSTRREPGRELAVVAARLRHGAREWDAAAPFWDAPDRNDHGSALFLAADGRILHFNGLSTDTAWSKLALIVRESDDNGATWSPARIIEPEHGLRHQVIAGAFRAPGGAIVVACDAVPGGRGGTSVHISRDGGWSWTDPGAGRPAPRFAAGASGAWIAGIHAGVTWLEQGRWLALGRGDAIGGHMPRSLSDDLGASWRYSSSGLPPIGGGQRVVLLHLREGPLFLASFARRQEIPGATGEPRPVSGLFAALSEDEGATWPIRRLITDGGPPRRVDGGGNTGEFTLGPDRAEPAGYLAGTQAPDGVIHLISSKQHYAFNLAWVRARQAPSGAARKR